MATGQNVQHYDTLVIGAGFGGIRALHEMRTQGLSAKVFEAATDVGGTWYWNRYPGCQTDSEAWVYCYSFSKEIQDEWVWPDRMPTWDQVVDYLRFVVAKLDLRKDIQFEVLVESARYDPASNLWFVTTSDGQAYTANYLISAAGLLSVAYEPPFPGLETFCGEWYLSARWPKDPVDFSGKRVGIVGSGSTAVQILPMVIQTAAHVSMLQRTPNYVVPNRNFPLDSARQKWIRENYDEIWVQARKQFLAFPIQSPGRCYDDVSDAERQRIFEAGWETGGFRFLFESFDDILTDERSNAAAAEFVRNKIRAIVHDQNTAELLCPNYPIGIKRPALGNFYFESFNRENVSLIDISNDPIEEITSTGIRTARNQYDFDIIIFAIGFDAITGALAKLDVRGADGTSMGEKWANGPLTDKGIMVDGFPNLFIISGPQSPFANIPPIIEGAVDWIGKAIAEARQQGANRIETTPGAVNAWREQVESSLDATLLGQGEEVHSWFFGANIPGKARASLFYFGGAGAYFEELEKSAAGGFAELTFSACEDPAVEAVA